MTVMTRSAFALAFALGMVLVGCDATSPTAPELDLPTENLGSIGAQSAQAPRFSAQRTTRSCYNVAGALDQTFCPTGLCGTISGDVEGTVTTVTDPAYDELHGVAYMRLAEQTWEVAGGTVAPLVGRTLRFENEFIGILATMPKIIVNTRGRVIEGAEKGNLTIHGWTDVSTFTSHLEYHGVICP
jgi:hypothetical protein